jgi:hypothetical protein
MTIASAEALADAKPGVLAAELAPNAQAIGPGDNAGPFEIVEPAVDLAADGSRLLVVGRCAAAAKFVREVRERGHHPGFLYVLNDELAAPASVPAAASSLACALSWPSFSSISPVRPRAFRGRELQRPRAAHYVRRLAESRRVCLQQRRPPDVPCNAGAGASFEYLAVLRELP